MSEKEIQVILDIKGYVAEMEKVEYLSTLHWLEGMSRGATNTLFTLDIITFETWKALLADISKASDEAFKRIKGGVEFE